MHTFVLKSSDLSSTSLDDIRNWRNQAHWLIVPCGEVSADYLNEISVKINKYANGDRGIVIDASRFFEKSPWKPPSITKDHLPIVLAINLKEWDNENLLQVLTKSSLPDSSSWPALQLDYEEACSLIYKYSNYYYQAGVLVTDFCNLRCEMCMFHSVNESEYEFRKLRRADRVQQEISRESLFSFIDQLISGASLLFSASGELLMCKRAMDYVEYASQKGNPPIVLTNGMLLTREVSARLLAAGVRQILISVDGTEEEIYQKRRKGGDLKKVLENLKNLQMLIEKRRLPASIDINTILFSDLEPQKDDIIAFWRDKVDQLTFLVERLDYLGRPRKLLMEPAPVRWCLEPMTGPLLLSNGLIAPCCSVAIGEWFEPMEWLLDIKETTLDQALKSYRLMMLDEESPLRKYCSRCHYWANSFWYNGKSPFSEIHKFDKPKKFFDTIKSVLKIWE
jgi:pyruvate-formate lyase-activating enzyme